MKKINYWNGSNLFDGEIIEHVIQDGRIGYIVCGCFYTPFSGKEHSDNHFVAKFRCFVI